MANWGVPTDSEVESALKAILADSDTVAAVKTLYGVSHKDDYAFREAIKSIMVEGGIRRADGRKWGTDEPVPSVAVLTKERGIVAEVTPFDGPSTTFYDFSGPYLGTIGSDASFWLAQGSIKRQIPYIEIATIEFDKALGDKWHEHPTITMKNGKKMKLKRREVAVWVGYSYEVSGRDADGLRMSINTRDVKSIRVH